VDWLLKEYAGEWPGLVIFDVIYGMGMADDNGVRDVVPVITALKRISAAWGAATVAVGHPGLAGERRLRGSSAWSQLAAVEWHLADSWLTCEKLKIADKRRLGTAYRADYPTLTWLSPGETVVAEAERLAVIEKDLDDYPGDSDRSRALRLMTQLGVQERRARDLIRDVRRARGDR
jgi:hypothetical protein